MFQYYELKFDKNLFNELSNKTFENITNGRIGANLIKVSNNLFPIVRTTTKYSQPLQYFDNIHYNIIDKIKDICKINNLEFNNAMIEIYNSNYKTMKYHSDQALDLHDNSYICIFSCYNNEHTNEIRTLLVKEKNTDNVIKYKLHHNSIILFSVNDNSKYNHKIILESDLNTNTKWLGITFRFSKTLINFINNIPYLSNNEELILINRNDIDKIKEFYKLRNLENKSINFKYPEINYTISPSDLLMPKLND